MSPEVESILSLAVLFLMVLLSWAAFARTKWASRSQDCWITVQVIQSSGLQLRPVARVANAMTEGETPIQYLPRRSRRGPPQTAGYRVDRDTGCWIWTGARIRGYGRQGKAPAHRVAWELLVGPIPEGHDLHHLCSNRLCVNPEHLEPRLPHQHRGRNGQLTEAQLTRILELVREGRTLTEIANDLGVPYLVVSGLKLGGLYRRVAHAKCSSSET